MRINFSYHHSSNPFLRAIEICQLIYRSTLREQRKNSRYPIIGLIKTMGQALLMVGFFYVMFSVIGRGAVPVRGDFVMFLLTGVLGYVNHLKGFQGAASAPSPSSPLMQHAPMTSFLAIMSGMLSALYTVAFTTIILLYFYDAFFADIYIHNVVGFAMMMALSSLSGTCIGLVAYGAEPFAHSTVSIVKTIYQRVSMLASGKMLLANYIPSSIYPFFVWHPLFHINDQARGYAFNNYFPHKTSLSYALTFMLVCFVIGVVLMYLAKQRSSMSWETRRI